MQMFMRVRAQMAFLVNELFKGEFFKHEKDFSNSTWNELSIYQVLLVRYQWAG